MELNQLDYFRTVARLENMTKAAEALYVSQPNLSTSIARLESSLGIQLFSRSKGHIYLTESGKQFLAHVENIFGELDAAIHTIQESQEYREDSIALAASFSGILPRLFPYYYEDYGLLPTTQLILPTEEIAARLRAGTLDLGIVAGEAAAPGLTWTPVCSAPLVAVAKSFRSFADGAPCRLAHLSTAHFICNTLYYEKKLLLDLCAQAGFSPRLVRVSNEQEVFDERSFDFGDNVTLCPLHMIPELTQTDQFSLQFLPLEDPFAHVEIGLLQNEENIRTPLVAEFYHCAKDYVRQIIEAGSKAGADIIARLQK